MRLLQNSLKERDQSVEALRARVEQLEKRNLELKQRLNGTILTGDQVAELLSRIEKLEKQAQK